MATGISSLLAGFIGLAGGKIPAGGEIVGPTEHESADLGSGDPLTIAALSCRRASARGGRRIPR